MYTIAEYRDCLERLAAILAQCQVRFCLTGGAAFIAYGDPRTTQDVDLGELSRAVEIELMPDLRLPVVCLPDLVASKLVWISKGSHKSRRDVKVLMSIASEAESAQAREAVRQFGLETLLDDVLAEPDEPDV